MQLLESFVKKTVSLNTRTFKYNLFCIFKYFLIHNSKAI